MKSANLVIKPKALKKGDIIGVVATGAPLEQERLERGLDAITRRGFKFKMPLSPAKYYASNCWSNGSVSERLAAFNELIFDPEVKAIISARGGYGTPQLLPYLEISKFNKVLVGLSDFCPLLIQNAFVTGVHSIHAASVGTSLADELSNSDAKADTDELFEVLSNPDWQVSHACSVLRAGSARGKILVSNLSMLCFLLGTEYDISYDNCILVLEDVGEAPFRIHRMLLQLQFAAKFDRLAGLVFGRFSKCEAKHGPGIEDVYKIFVAENTNTFPVLKGLPAGHWGRNVPLPLACEAEITEYGDLKILDSPVS